MKNSKLIKILIASGVTLSIGALSISYVFNNEGTLNNSDMVANVEDSTDNKDNSDESINEDAAVVEEAPVVKAAPQSTTNTNNKANNASNSNQQTLSTDKEDVADTNNSASTTPEVEQPSVDTSKPPVESQKPSTEPSKPSVEPSTPPTEPSKPSIEPSTPPTETNKPSVDANKPSNDNTNNSNQSSSYVTEIEQIIFQKVNEERVKAGVPALSYNNTMQKYARIKSKDMGDRNYFDHTNPEGELITAQMQRDGVSYQAWGENIAYISGASGNSSLASQFMSNWMNSSGHRANILSTDFSSIGIGVYKIGNTYYATQEFYR